MKKTFATFYAGLMMSYVILLLLAASAGDQMHRPLALHLPSLVASVR